MVRRTITMKKTREIIRLLESGARIRAVARAVNKSRTPVENIQKIMQEKSLTYEQVSTMDDKSLKQIIYPEKDAETGRKAHFKKLIPEINKKLQEKHETLQHVWEGYKINYPEGYQYSHFCYHLSRWRKNTDIPMALEHKYGDMMFVDWAGDKLTYFDLLQNKEIEVDPFVAILPASQYTYAECRHSQKKEDWIPSNENAIRFFGGSTAGIVPDCTKTAVKIPHRYESEINPQYEQFAAHYNTAIIPARAGHPRDKALVENAINNICAGLLINYKTGQKI